MDDIFLNYFLFVYYCNIIDFEKRFFEKYANSNGKNIKK